MTIEDDNHTNEVDGDHISTVILMTLPSTSNHKQLLLLGPQHQHMGRKGKKKKKKLQELDSKEQKKRKLFNHRSLL
jgi:hypothetical protein